MARDDLTAEDAARWKRKYLDYLEEQERKERAGDQHLNLLRRALARVSVAANGLDGRLDEQLAALREAIRQPDAAPEIAPLLDRIEASVLRLDSEKAQAAGSILEGFRRLLAQLQALALPRELKSDLDRFGKHLRSRSASTHEYAALVSEFAALQAQALAGGSAEAPSGGLLQRLLGRPSPAAPALADHALEADPAPRLPATSAATPFERVAPEVGERLRSLLSQLQLPESVRPQQAELDATIGAGVRCDNLLEILEALAGVILAAVGREQEEFEGFLQTLNDRLGEIHGFLRATHSDHTAARQGSDELDQAMRSQIDSIKTSVHDAHDLEQLKQAVQSQVEGILSSMDALRAMDLQRESQLGEQLQTLMQRMESMETEARTFRSHLEQQRQDALRDVLTGMPNRQAYEERIKAEVARVKRYGGSLALAVVDVDHFKRVNDSYGHLAGDKVLKVIAKTVAGSLREADFIARYGGEEFVLVMPETNAEQAQHVVEKLRKAVEVCRFHYQKTRVPITVSFGIAEYTGGESIEALFARADRALYRAKAEGRNRFCVESA